MCSPKQVQNEKQPEIFLMVNEGEEEDMQTPNPSWHPRVKKREVIPLPTQHIKTLEKMTPASVIDINS